MFINPRPTFYADLIHDVFDQRKSAALPGVFGTQLLKHPPVVRPNGHHASRRASRAPFKPGWASGVNAGLGYAGVS